MNTFKTTSGGQPWDVAANWSTGVVPQPTDDVVVTGPASGVDAVSIAAADPAYTVHSLTLTGQNTNFPFSLIDTGSLTVTGTTSVSADGELMLTGTGNAVLQGTTTLGNGGYIYVGSGQAVSLTVGTLVGSSLSTSHFIVYSGTATVGTTTGATTFTVQSGAQLFVGQTSGNDFYGLNSGALKLGSAATTLTDGLDAVSGTSTVDLTKIAFQAGETATLTKVTSASYPTYTVKLMSAQGQTLYTINALSGAPTGPAPLITVSSDTAGGTLLSIACYTPGTLIHTPAGEVEAGSLVIGDLVITLSGEAKPIVWIGRRSYAGRFLARQLHLLPVRIQAGALGGGLPRRDLLVSPCHAMFLDGVLVPASSLVNGSTIRQESRADRVDYVHIELADHDVIFAEGAPSETFLDDDSRNAFHNASEYAALYGEGVGVDPVYHSPRLTDGFVVEAIRARLAAIEQNQQAA